MSSITLSGGNARLSYNLKGSHIAMLRCKQLTINYGVDGQESHAKRYRAFYPYQRVQGTFSMTFDFIHWAEFNKCMKWFQTYIEAVIGQHDPSYMQVQLDSRKFLRLAYPTTGIAFGDHVGSTVFSPTITFVSVADPRDAKSGIKTLNKSVSSVALPPGNQVSTNWFYPTSKLNNPGQLQSYIYDQAVLTILDALADLQDTIDGITGDDGSTTGGTGGPDKAI